MRIARFEYRGAVCRGIVEGEALALVEGSDLRRTGVSVALADVRLLSPVEPPNVLAIGLNYGRHASESGMKLPERPLLFIKATTSVIGPDDPIVLPGLAPEEVDYEAELCLVIGRTARHVSEAEALDYVLGYTCGNDVSARDCQLRLDGQWARGKSFDTFCPLGPWIETPPRRAFWPAPECSPDQNSTDRFFPGRNRSPSPGPESGYGRRAAPIRLGSSRSDRACERW